MASENDVRVWHYTLRTDDGAWLAEVMLSASGMFAAVSEWGNYAFAWRAFGDDFRSFMSGMARDPDYVTRKVAGGGTRGAQREARRFCDKVLPVLARAIEASKVQP